MWPISRSRGTQGRPRHLQMNKESSCFTNVETVLAKTVMSYFVLKFKINKSSDLRLSYCSTQMYLDIILVLTPIFFHYFNLFVGFFIVLHLNDD